jgi:hypothetical protein
MCRAGSTFLPGGPFPRTAKEEIMSVWRRFIGRGLACLVVVAAGASFDQVALAHRPIFTDDAAAGPETAIQVRDPRISQVVYREITKESPQVWLAFTVPEDFQLFVQIGVPVIDRLEGFRPAIVVVGAGLPHGDPPFKLPEGAGAVVLKTGDVQKPRRFHEPFTNTDSWILRSETVALPKAGRCFLVACSPDGQFGKLWLSVGRKESFTLKDLKEFPAWTRKIRAFHEMESNGPAAHSEPAEDK